MEWDRPVYLGFIDFKKAFDSLERWAVFLALQRCLVDDMYVQIIGRCAGGLSYKLNCTT